MARSIIGAFPYTMELISRVINTSERILLKIEEQECLQDDKKWTFKSWRMIVRRSR